MIVFIARNDAEEELLESLLICSACQEPSVIGHGCLWRADVAPPLDLHSSRPVQVMPSHNHNAATVVGPWRALQPGIAIITCAPVSRAWQTSRAMLPADRRSVHRAARVSSAMGEPGGLFAVEFSAGHHVCLGLEAGKLYSDRGGQFTIAFAQRNHLRRMVLLLTCLDQPAGSHWLAASRTEVYGRCPLHLECLPSFYVNRRKDVFFCHGCGQGGNVSSGWLNCYSGRISALHWQHPRSNRKCPEDC